MEVHGPLGRYIEAEDRYEESVYLCVFRLAVPSAGPAPYTPAEALDRGTLFKELDKPLTGVCGGGDAS